MVRKPSGKRRFVPYYRVSTVRQGRSGLGLEAQRQYVQSYLASLGAIDYALAKERVEVKGGKSIRRRPELKAALEECRLTGATLLIARLDRLSRDATFLFNLQDSGVGFIACDMPEADRTMIGVMALVAEREGKMISARTKEALAAAKRRGTQLGNRPGESRLSHKQRLAGNASALETIRERTKAFALQLRSTFDELEAHGVTGAHGIAQALNGRGILTIKGHQWTAAQVQRVQQRLGVKD